MKYIEYIKTVNTGGITIPMMSYAASYLFFNKSIFKTFIKIENF